MFNTPTEEQLNQLPKLYETEHKTSLPDKLIYLHFFIGGCDWYIAEYDGQDLFFGFAILNGDYQNAEWGYISFSELKSIKVAGCIEVDFDLYWEPKPAIEIENIRRAHKWVKGECYV